MWPSLLIARLSTYRICRLSSTLWSCEYTAAALTGTRPLAQDTMSVCQNLIASVHETQQVVLEIQLKPFFMVIVCESGQRLRPSRLHPRNRNFDTEDFCRRFGTCSGATSEPSEVLRLSSRPKSVFHSIDCSRQARLLEPTASRQFLLWPFHGERPGSHSGKI